MGLFLDIVLLLVGFVLLIYGAKYFVLGASDLAIKFRIPEFIVGLTIVALGTSAPELAVSITAATSGSNEMVVSNVLGSNLFNIMMVLGFVSFFKAITVDKKVLLIDYPVTIFASLLFAAFLTMGNDINRWEALVFVLCTIAYMTWTVISALKEKKSAPKEEENDDKDKKAENEFKAWKCALFIICGAVAIIYGGDFVVNHAKNIGYTFGMSEALVGLTICAVGTSLPEFTTSVTATRTGHNDMALGNVIGSNVFNIFCILGVSGLISPISLTEKGSEALVTNTVFDLYIFIAVTLITYVFCWTDKTLKKWEGFTLILLYFAYMAYALYREFA